MPTLKTLQATGHHSDSTVSTEPFYFQCTAYLYDSDGVLVVDRDPIWVTPEEDGTWEVDLYANNDPDTTPPGSAYEEYRDGKLVNTVVVPYNQASPINYASLPTATTTVYNAYATQAALTTLKAASVEVVMGATVSASQTAPQYVFRAPAACTITYAALATSASFALHADNWWLCELRRYRAGASAVIATKSTDADGTNPEAVASATLWEFSPATFDSGNKVLQAGDLVAFFLTRGGTVAAITNPQYMLGYTLD